MLSGAVPPVSQCDLRVTEVWEQKELEATYPKSHAVHSPRVVQGGTRPGPPAASVCYFHDGSLGRGGAAASECKCRGPGWPQPVSCVSFQAWLAEVEGRLPARGEQRRQSGLYEAQPAPAVNNCAQARERYSVRAALPSGGFSVLDARPSADPSASVTRACGSPARLLAPRGPFKMVSVASCGPHGGRAASSCSVAIVAVCFLS